MTDRLKHRLASLLAQGRARTLALIDGLDDDEVHDQPLSYLSPLVWDLGHIANFEHVWLVRALDAETTTDRDLDEIYNAFDTPRGVRGQVRLLPRHEALAYLEQVRSESLATLRGIELDDDEPLLAGGQVHRMISQHESQHQETMLQSMVMRGLAPTEPMASAPSRHARRVDDTDRVAVPDGPVVLGTDERSWSYDNERPAHAVRVLGFTIDRFPVTTRRYAAFIDDDGYRRPELWSARGWQWLQDEGHVAPEGWRRTGDGQWWLQRFAQLEPLDPHRPVERISYFEAEAFARWAGGRLPSEVEWEKVAGWDPARQRKRRFPWGDTPPTPRLANVGAQTLGPAPVGAYPHGASAYGAEQLAGDVYEWTASPFDGYPGFAAYPYPEYSQVFFGGDYRVLRGSSWAIGAPFARTTYRNWDHPYRRQVFAGLRVAYDLDGADRGRA